MNERVEFKEESVRHRFVMRNLLAFALIHVNHIVSQELLETLGDRHTNKYVPIGFSTAAIHPQGF